MTSAKCRGAVGTESPCNCTQERNGWQHRRLLHSAGHCDCATCCCAWNIGSFKGSHQKNHELMSCSPLGGRKQLILKCQYLTLWPRNKIFFFFDLHICGVCQPQVPCCSCCSVDMGPNSKQLWNEFALRLNMSGHVLTRASENAEEKWVKKHCQSSKCLQKKQPHTTHQKSFDTHIPETGPVPLEIRKWIEFLNVVYTLARYSATTLTHFLETVATVATPVPHFFLQHPSGASTDSPANAAKPTGRKVQVITPVTAMYFRPFIPG